MKKEILVLAAIVLGVIIVGNLQAAEKPSAALGEQLFNDPALGGTDNVQSCNSCHPGGKDLEDAGDDPELATIINRCITGALGGQALPEDSPQIQSINLYIASLKGKK